MVQASPIAAQTSTATTGAAATILPGDQITLRIEREREMSGTYTVDETGDLVLPRLGAVKVVGRTAGSLQELLRTGYARYLRDPAIAVTVLRRITVQGEVARPGLYMVDLTTSLGEVLAQAGGITEAGDTRKVEIIRDGGRSRVDAGPHGSFVGAELRSGDRVVVNRRSWISRNPNAVIGTFTGAVGLFITVVNLPKG